MSLMKLADPMWGLSPFWTVVIVAAAFFRICGGVAIFVLVAFRLSLFVAFTEGYF